MSISQSYLDFILERLSVIGSITSRRMFGGVGLYHQGVFFALIDDDVLYFKVDDTTRPDYEKVGMNPFLAFPVKPDSVMSYYEVPADVLEDDGELARWAKKAVAIAAAKSKKRNRPLVSKPKTRKR